MLERKYASRSQPQATAVQVNPQMKTWTGAAADKAFCHGADEYLRYKGKAGEEKIPIPICFFEKNQLPTLVPCESLAQ